ncbi:MDR family MFS transporter [Leuconostoc inhae]|uniref:MDR family MFS transporter n=1 Tax=Leuconostoc inhae TaxID=178001 RepID=UPI0007E1D964|nr:MDR family MFS transporter [Leuconostoc inhae]CUW17235.1 Drug resistance transporter, EmrB/QacA subfamily [Leuconostoc inhae]
MLDKKQNKVPQDLMTMAWILVLGSLAPMLDGTMVNIAIPHFVTTFHSTLAHVQWIASAYLLTMGIAIPFSDWLLNRFDGRLAYFWAQVIFLVGSIIASLSPNLNWLIVARIIQGFGAGLLIPMLTTLLVQQAGPYFRKLMIVVGLPMMLGPIFGPIIGGLIMNSASWEWIFLVNVPVSLLAIIDIFWKLPHMPAQNTSKPFDLVGTLLMGGFVTALIYAVVKADKTLWNGETKPFIILGIALLILYLIWAYIRKETAVLPLHLFKFHSYVGATVGLILASIIMNGTSLLLTTYFQSARGFSALNASYALIPQGIGMFLARPLTGKLMDKLGVRNLVFGSLILVVAGLVALTQVDETTSMWLISVILFISGVGINTVFVPLMTDAYTGMPKQDVPEATIGTRIFQNVGGAYGTSLVSMVVSNKFTQLLTQQQTALTSHPNLAQHLYSTALSNGFTWLAWLAFAIVLPCLLLSGKEAK